MRRLIETAVSVAVALTLIGTWLVEPYSVVSGSMSPTLLGPHREFVCGGCGRHVVVDADVPPMSGRPAFCPHCRTSGPIEASLPIVPGDGLLVDRSAFMRREPRRGEVVAFRLPQEAAKIAVKRIVGLPGETISLRDGKFFADDTALDLFAADYSPPRWYQGPTQWKLADDEYFVAGDNPAHSDDSRLWIAGPGVAAQLIIGKPFIVHAPRRIVVLAGRAFHVPDLSAIRYIR